MNAIPPIVPASVPTPVAAMTDAAFALTVGLLLLAPMAIAGVALINTGLGRSRSAAQAMLGNLALIAVAAIVFAFVGASFAGSLGPAEVVLHLAGKPWSVLGLGSFLLHGLNAATPQSQLAVLFEFLSVAMLVAASMGLRSGSLEARCRLRLRSHPCRHCFSARRALDLGWWMARNSGHKLRDRRRLS